MLDERLPILLIQMDEDFGVAPGSQTMALAFQLPREGSESVDFPVERDPDGPVLIPERLPAAADVNDREAGIDEEDVLGGTDVVAAAVRAAVTQGSDHPAASGLDLFPLERELTRDSAHLMSINADTSAMWTTQSLSDGALIPGFSFPKCPMLSQRTIARLAGVLGSGLVGHARRRINHPFA